MRIIFIEDNETFGNIIKLYLHKAGYTVDWFQDGASANAILQTNEYFDLVIMDKEILGWSWEQWLKTFKKKNPLVPILMVTGTYSSPKSLNKGVDVCLIKYRMDKETLLSNVGALLRRAITIAKSAADSILRYQHITLDLKAREVQANGIKVDLSRREFALLHKLLSNVGHVISREKLVQSIYGWEEQIDSNALEVHIHNLRHKLKGNFIKTVRGIGYMIIRASE